MNKTVNAEATSSFGNSLILIDASPSPDHKEIAKGTLRAIIREAGLTVEDFKALL